VFDRSSTHKGFAKNALNINNMNVNPEGRQRKLRDTVIPLNNPGPALGEEDTCGCVQHMCFPKDHNVLELRGQAKGIKVVLQECKSVWDIFALMCEVCCMKMVGKCASCMKSQVHKDAEHHSALAEEIGKEDTVSTEDPTHIETKVPPVNNDVWCCMFHVLALQEDF